MSFDGPLVSLLTPTRDRHAFLQLLCRMISAQTYPRNRMELIVIDDGIEPADAVLRKHEPALPRLEYVHLGNGKAASIGEKRQAAMELAIGDVLVNVDDDDFYPRTRVAHAVARLRAERKQLAGCSLLPIWDLRTQRLYRSGPYHENHATSATLAFTRDYAESHSWANVSARDEDAFTNGFSEEMVQLKSLATIVCINHGKNTIPKEPTMREVWDLPLEKIVIDPQCQAAYSRTSLC